MDDSHDKDTNYYKVLDFLDNLPEGNLDKDVLKEFKEVIRDNKYVSTYIRAFKEQMKGYENIDDFIKMMDKQANKKSFDDVVPFMIRGVMNSYYNYEKMETDPIKIINTIIFDALEREGKICDFRDSVNPNKSFGRCESEEHHEMVTDDLSVYGLTDAEIEEYEQLQEDGEDGYQKFIDKFNPPQELELTLYQDCDINKFDDQSTCYVCKNCMEYIRDNGDCEVSCDMG